MKIAHIGTISELKAQIWLLNQGLEVFANIKPSGPIDIVTWDQEKNIFQKIDVKTIRIYKKVDGTKSYMFSGLGNFDPNSKNKNVIDGISYLGYCEEEDTFLWFEESIRAP
jgi:hypothetical protein